MWEMGRKDSLEGVSVGCTLYFNLNSTETFGRKRTVVRTLG